MRFRLFCLTAAILCTTFLFAQRPNKNQQQITVSGKAIDAETGQPLEYATLVLESLDIPGDVTGGVTDFEGNFSVDAPVGKYNIKLEYISYKPYVLNNQNLTADRDLGTVKLTLNVSELDAVEVTGEKTTVEIRLDKKVYNIGKDLTTSGGTVSDALNNVPSVTVDVEGAIALRGNENVRILINGKPSALAGFGSTEALRQLPADAIEKVEVITSPSARYDAEGTAGILNIILKKEKTLGFNGSVNLNTGFPISSQTNVNLNLRTDKFNVFTTLGHFYREPPGNAFFDNTYFNSKFDRIIEDRDYTRQDQGFNINLGMEYFLTETSSITGSFFTRFSDEKDATENNTVRFINSSVDSRTFREEIENEDDQTYQFSLNYTNDLDEDGQQLTADLQYSRDKEVVNTDIDENQFFPTNELINREKVFEDERETEFLAQVDYVLPMGEAQFEAGGRSTYEKNVNDYQLDVFNPNSNAFETNINLTNEFTYIENVNAIYTQYGNKFGKFSFLAGLRLENTRLRGKVVSEIDEEELSDTLGIDFDPDFDKKYLNLFPTVNLTYEIQENENITLGYNRRINRPRGWFVNPFPSRSSRANIFQGNPDLNPAFADAFDLGYLKRWDKLTLTSSVYYQRETDAFERIQRETGQETSDGIEIVSSIPINLATEQRYGGEVGVMYSGIKWLRLNGSFNFFKFEKEGEYDGIDYGASNTSWFSRLSAKVNLPAKIDWQTNGFYMGPRENSQTKTEGMVSIDMAFSKDIMDDNATISLNVNDMFNSRIRRSFTEAFNDMGDLTFTSDSEFQWRQRQFTVSFIYRFNQPKNQREERRGNDGNGDDGGEYGGA
ncbi:TonB-dependent receptor domain-containing protein [Galbibacter mesophilus]|uniref:TonB-dependent receptor domain-containing protein n=1 Tax=Galbibacter mesophilus TaxID=379069 RepID=UPI00191FE7D0|nr:TonB-dependent receptor [Galbibacter mesophilus]MCM5663592.1 TonB-dependent receptor [Galbibacter mesophilus]